MQQRRHRDLPALADRAEQVLLGHLDVAEEDLVELGVTGDLPERPHLDAGRVHVGDHVGQVVVPALVGQAETDEDAVVGDVRERRPHLLPVDEEVVAAILDPRADGRQVAACVGLREALAPDLLGAQDLREVALLVGLTAPRHDRRPRHAEADHAEVRRCLGARRLLEEDRLVAVRRAGPAELLRPGETRVPGLAEQAAPLAVGVLEPATAAPLRALGNVLRDELADFLPERGFLGRVAEVHRGAYSRTAGALPSNRGLAAQGHAGRGRDRRRASRRRR